MNVPLRSAQVGKAEVAIFAGKQALYDAGAEVFYSVVRHNLTTTGICNIALSGGSTPKALYALIADRVQNSPDLRSVEWHNVHFFFGDERCVPPDHADSNYGMVRASLLKNGAIPESTVHRVHAERSPAEAADEYERELREHFNGNPKFDLIFLGMGPDGHTASLFPDTAALTETQRLVVANYVPKFNADRITLTYPVLNAAKNVLFLVAGEDKQHALKSVLVDHQLPASKVQPTGELMWYADSAAAALLPA